MAAGRLPEPGSKYLCKAICEHTDCADIRRVAETLCRVCREAIGYNRRFYRDTDHATMDDFVHAVCLETKPDRD